MSVHRLQATEPWFIASGTSTLRDQAVATIGVVSCLRLASAYTKPFARQLLNLQQTHCSVASVVIVHDKPNEQTESVLAYLRSTNLPICFVQEKETDAHLDTMSAKAVQWASIANQGIEECLKSHCTHLLWLEPDLCFPLDLLDRLAMRGCDIVAPVVFFGSAFYDTWGFRDLQGNTIASVADFCREAPGFFSLVEVGSVGSCVLFNSGIFKRGVRFRGEHENGLLVGVCQDARKIGYRVWVDTATSIIHPTNLWREQVWVVDSLQAVTPNGHKLLDLQNANIPVGSILPDYFERWLRQMPELAKKAQYPWQSIKVEKDLEKRRVGVSIVAGAKPQLVTIMRSTKARAKNAIRRLLRPFRS